MEDFKNKPMINIEEDATSSFIDFIESPYAKNHMDPDRYTKIVKSLDFIAEKGLQIHFIKKTPYGDILGIYLVDQNDEKQGEFSVRLREPHLLATNLEEDEGLLKKGLSRLMIAAFIFEMIQRGEMEQDTVLFVGADSSDGFWESIGMHPVGDDPSNPYYGLDFYITLGELSQWAFGYTFDGLNRKTDGLNKKTDGLNKKTDGLERKTTTRSRTRSRTTKKPRKSASKGGRNRKKNRTVKAKPCKKPRR